MPNHARKSRVSLEDILREFGSGNGSGGGGGDKSGAMEDGREEPYASVEMVSLSDVQKAAYQRDVRDLKIRQFVREWDQLICGLPEISARPDGSYYVVDGQHRIIAMILRGEKGEVPMLVWRGLTPEQEARKFGGSQDPRNRTAITQEEVHKASVFAGDETAVLIDRAIRDAGFVVGRSQGGNTVRAMKMVRDIEERYGVQMLESVLAFVVAAWGTDNPPKGPLLMGTAMFMAMFPGANYTSLIRRVSKKPMETFFQDARSKGKILGILNVSQRVARELHAEHNTVIKKNALPPFEDAMEEHVRSIRSASAKKVRARNAK